MRSYYYKTKICTMKNLKFSLIIAFLLSINSNTINAQENDKKADVVAEMKIAKEKLALSESQEITFKEITKKYGLKMKAVKDSDEPKRNKFKSMKSIKEDKNAEMKTLLSDEQYKVYIELQEERIAKMKENKRK